MSHAHDHAHSHSGHHDHHGHHEHGPRRQSAWLRLGGALLVALAIGASACVVQVRSGTATIVTRFGNPNRVLTQPGLALRLPVPFEQTIDVDLRTKTTSSGLQDVGTKDGLRVIAQAYAIWQVPDDPQAITRFVRAVSNDPDQAADQIRTFLGSSLETVASHFDLSSLINVDAEKVDIDGLEQRLQADIAAKLFETYGLRVVGVGLERLTLPAATLEATVARMRAQRETIATERTATGKRQAAEIRSAAERDARGLQADTAVKAADIEAQSRIDAARIYGDAYKRAPELYQLLRSLDTLGSIVNTNTRLVLRTDAAPFRALIDGPPTVSLPSNATGQGK